jgi:hypothetical protein
MKTITSIAVSFNVCAMPGGFYNPKSHRELFKLNEHIKRKQNE